MDYAYPEMTIDVYSEEPVFVAAAKYIPVEGLEFRFDSWHDLCLDSWHQFSPVVHSFERLGFYVP